MQVGVLIVVVLILLIALVLVPLIYWFLSKKGFKKTALILCGSILLIILVPTFSFIFEEELYFESDVTNDLKNVDVTLKEDFTIIDVKIIGTTDYYQFVKVEISDTDKNKIIEEISKANNFKIVNEKINYSLINTAKNKETKNYQNVDYYIRQSKFKPSGYTATNTSITVSKRNNIMELSVIMD